MYFWHWRLWHCDTGDWGPMAVWSVRWWQAGCWAAGRVTAGPQVRMMGMVRLGDDGNWDTCLLPRVGGIDFRVNLFQSSLEIAIFRLYWTPTQQVQSPRLHQAEHLIMDSHKASYLLTVKLNSSTHSIASTIDLLISMSHPIMNAWWWSNVAKLLLFRTQVY